MTIKFQNTMELIWNDKLIYLGKNCVIVGFIKVHVFHGFSPLCLKLQVAEGVLTCKEWCDHGKHRAYRSTQIRCKNQK